MTVITWIIAFITGILSSMGVGGGMLLIIWMTSFIQINQFNAQGINLLFFIPVALLSVIRHCRSGMIDIKTMLPGIAAGIIGTVFGFYAANTIDTELLKDIFSVFLIIIGFKELFFGISPKREN